MVPRAVKNAHTIGWHAQSDSDGRGNLPAKQHAHRWGSGRATPKYELSDSL